jgi:O-acetylhomoserine (thiol)-lyase
MKNIETTCVQSGYKPKKGEPRITPIYQSTTYYYEKASELADLFDLKENGYFYTRLANPTVAVLEQKVAALEGGSNAVATSSGMSATMFTVLNLCKTGDNILSSQAVYGGTFNLFDVTLRKFGIECRFFNPDDSIENIEKLIDDNTKLIFAETIANPAIIILDIEKIAKIAKKYKILFAVDNTLASPVLCRPLEFGANLIVHSSSKYLDGHAAALGGLVVDGGNFDYKGNERYPDFNIPDDSYHGVVYADMKETAFGAKCRLQIMRDMGAMMSPQNAFITNLGTETLALRMDKHSSNATKVAEFLESCNKVEWVKHPSLKSNKYYDLAKKYLPVGQGGMMSFGIKGGERKAAEFMENLKMIAIVTHVADVRSCVLHPASTTHRQLSKESLMKAGIPDNLIRLSVGIENAEDIISDLKQALDLI